MNPNDVWAIPPPATQGDKDPFITFGAVGAALSDWERFEGHLALIFSALIGTDRSIPAARRAYGTIVSFGGRADMLSSAAEMYFIDYPDESLDADLTALMKLARKGASRRNEIAHGIVQPMQGALTMFTGATYALYPAYYSTSRRDSDFLPKYAYTSVEISRFARQFHDLVAPASSVLDRIRGKHLSKP